VKDGVYCSSTVTVDGKDDGDRLPEPDNHGFDIDALACQKLCEKQSECKMFTSGTWSKGLPPFTIAGIDMGGFKGKVRCQMYRQCTESMHEGTALYMRPPPSSSDKQEPEKARSWLSVFAQYYITFLLGVVAIAAIALPDFSFALKSWVEGMVGLFKASGPATKESSQASQGAAEPKVSGKSKSSTKDEDKENCPKEPQQSSEMASPAAERCERRQTEGMTWNPCAVLEGVSAVERAENLLDMGMSPDEAKQKIMAEWPQAFLS